MSGRGCDIYNIQPTKSGMEEVMEEKKARK
jgi:hypothetical protein